MVSGGFPQLIFTTPAGYLLPVMTFALIMLTASCNGGLFKALRFTGVFVHELLHFIVGFVVQAKPTSFTLVPRQDGTRIVLGSVGFIGLTWVNAWLTGLAPLLAMPIVYALASWRVNHMPAQFQWWDVGLWILLAPQMICCWPSRADLRIALISWPVLLLIGGCIFWWARGQDWSDLLAWSSVFS